MNAEKRSVKLSGAGTALLLMLFFVLCLTVLCALSLLSAAADLRLAKTYAASVQGYYEADAQATRVLYALTKANLDDPPAAFDGAEVALAKENGLYVARYLCGAGENQALRAEVLLDGAGRYRVLTWKLESTFVYTIDESIDVFDAASGQK